MTVDRIVFVYASEQLTAPLLYRMLVHNSQELTPDRFGIVRLTDILTADCVSPTVTETMTADKNASSLTGHCGESSRVLYHLIRNSLGGEDLSYSNFIRPFCRPLDLAATALTSLPPASSDIRIFLSHLPEDVPAFEIKVLSGVIVDRSGSASNVLEMTCISSDEEDQDVLPKQSTGTSMQQENCHSSTVTVMSVGSSDEVDHEMRGQNAEHAQLKIRPVQSCQLMESTSNRGDNKRVSVDTGDCFEDVTTVQEEEEPNQVYTVQYYLLPVLVCNMMRKP
jgi:hypothetical protein